MEASEKIILICDTTNFENLRNGNIHLLLVPKFLLDSLGSWAGPTGINKVGSLTVTMALCYNIF